MRVSREKEREREGERELFIKKMKLGGEERSDEFGNSGRIRM